MSHRPDVEQSLGFDPVHSFWDKPIEEQFLWEPSDPYVPTGGGGGEIYDLQGLLGGSYFPAQWDIIGTLPTTKDIAQVTYDVLDPYYGEGGMLEPVTVWVDPERELYDEYGPQIDTALLVIGAIAAVALLK